MKMTENGGNQKMACKVEHKPLAGNGNSGCGASQKIAKMSEIAATLHGKATCFHGLSSISAPGGVSRVKLNLDKATLHVVFNDLAASLQLYTGLCKGFRKAQQTQWTKA